MRRLLFCHHCNQSILWNDCWQIILLSSQQSLKKDSKTEKGSFSPQPFCFNSSIQIWWWVLLLGIPSKTYSIHIILKCKFGKYIATQLCKTQNLLFSLVHSSDGFGTITIKLALKVYKMFALSWEYWPKCTSTIQSSSDIQIPDWMIATMFV